MNGVQNYKLAIELLVLPDSYRPFIAVLDSGASHNIIREDSLPQNWERSGMVDPYGKIRSLQDARGAISQNVATIYLEIKLGCEKQRLRFLVMKELAVPVLLGCEFIDDHVTSIRSQDKTIQMNSGTIIPLYRRPVSKTPTPVYLAQPILLPPFSETNVPVTTDNEGTCLIQAVTANRTFQKRNYATAPGISDIKNSQTFMLKVANYGKKPILLQKHTTMGIATTLSAEVLTFSETSAEPSDKRDETGHDSDWKEELKIDHLSGNDQELVVKMLSKHSSM
jgi:Retroviral aspartyl protease